MIVESILVIVILIILLLPLTLVIYETRFPITGNEVTSVKSGNEKVTELNLSVYSSIVKVNISDAISGWWANITAKKESDYSYCCY